MPLFEAASVPRGCVDQEIPAGPCWIKDFPLPAKRREEPPSDEGPSVDEGVASKDAGWRGQCEPMQAGVGYTSRECCQSLAEVGHRGAHASRGAPVDRSCRVLPELL